MLNHEEVDVDVIGGGMGVGVWLEGVVLLVLLELTTLETLRCLVTLGLVRESDEAAGMGLADDRRR